MRWLLPIHRMRTTLGRCLKKKNLLEICCLPLNLLKISMLPLNLLKISSLQMKLFPDRLLPSAPRIRWILPRSSRS